MREVKIGSQNFTKVEVGGEPGQGGACHEYYISPADIADNVTAGEFGNVKFQNGPVKEFGINGCHQEDLIAIVLDRLQSFQKGDYACRENALAITKLEEAMHWLNHRTAARVASGVEGTNAK